MPRDTADAIIARPTIRMSGVEYPLLSAKIQGMVMREETGGLSSLELSFIDWISTPDGAAGFGATGDQPLKLGAQITVYAGDAAEPREIFSGRITALESEVRAQGAPLFTVLAEDALFTARKTRRRRVFEDASPADIVRAIAEDHGLAPRCRDGLDAPVRTWVQMNETDLGFLRRILDRLDADMQVVGEELQAGLRAAEPRSELTLSYPADLVAARFTADLAHQASDRGLAGFDPATGEPLTASSFDFDYGPGEGEDGAAVLEREFGPLPDHVGLAEPLDQTSLNAFADAAMRATARRFVRADATAKGNPEIRVGSRLTLGGMNPAFANVYTVTSARHRFGGGEYLTDFLAECGYLGSSA